MTSPKDSDHLYPSLNGQGNGQQDNNFPRTYAPPSPYEQLYEEAKSISEKSDLPKDPSQDGVVYLDADDYIDKVGQCGLYQIRAQIIFLFFMLPITSQIFIMYFIGHDPAWKCLSNSTICTLNGTISSQQPDAFNTRCSMGRKEWEYATDKEYSVVTQYDLVCDNAKFAIIVNSVMFIGWGFGGLTLPYVADKVGRKPTFFPATATIFVCAILPVLIANYWVMVIARFIIGVCMGGSHISIFVLASEIVGKKYRALSATMIWIYFAAAMLFLTLVAYLAKSWHTVELITILPFAFIFLMWSCVPESIRWYRVVGKTEKAEQLLKKIAKMNRKPEPHEKLIPEKKLEDSVNALALFHPCPMFIRTFIQCVGWFVSGITYFGMSLASEDLSGDLYRDFALTSLTESPANIILIILCNKLGRKKTVISHLFMAGISSLGVAAIPFGTNNTTYMIGRVVLGMIGKYAVTVYFNSFFIWSTELHATAIRVQALGIMVVCSRLGASFAPLIVTSLKFVMPALSFLLISVLNIIAAVLALKLKETNNRPLIETMEDMMINVGLAKKDEVDGTPSNGQQNEEAR